MSQEAVAAAIESRGYTISKIESGRHEIPASVLEQIANVALGLTMGEFYARPTAEDLLIASISEA